MPCRRASLCLGALLVYLEGVRFPGLLRDNKSISGFLFGPGCCEALTSLRHTHLGSFFLEPEDIKCTDLGAIWRFGRATGLL